MVGLNLRVIIQLKDEQVYLVRYARKGATAKPAYTSTIRLDITFPVSFDIGTNLNNGLVLFIFIQIECLYGEETTYPIQLHHI